MTLEELRDNPTSINKNLQIAGPAGVLNSPGTLTVNTQIYTPTSSQSVDESIQLITGAVVSASAAVGGLVMDTQKIMVSSGAGNCYWLPWGEGKVFHGTLAVAHEYFFTYTLNGCGFFIGGTEQAPEVAHANLDSPRLTRVVEQAMGMGAQGNAFAAREQALIYEQFYGNLAAKLIDRNLLTGRRVEVITPQRYLIDAGAGFGAIFGVQKAGSWKFYGNWAKKTEQVWP